MKTDTQVRTRPFDVECISLKDKPDYQDTRNPLLLQQNLEIEENFKRYLG